MQTVREGGGTPATDRLMQAILDTAMEYERVLVLSRKHQYDDAIDVMKRILSVMKDDAEYHAMYAWLLMQKFPGQGQEAPLQKMLESVDKALALHERHERANLLKAQILRRMGRQEDAFDYFRRVAEINPRNIDAMREVRVATMRSGGTPLAKPKPKGKPGKDKRRIRVAWADCSASCSRRTRRREPGGRQRPRRRTPAACGQMCEHLRTPHRHATCS